MSRQTVSTTRTWERITAKNRIQLSPEGHVISPVIGVCRALILEDDIVARQDYKHILDQVQTSPLGADIRALRGYQNPRRTKESYRFTLRMSVVADEFSEDVTPRFTEFAERWLYGSALGVLMMACMANLELLDIDPLDVENERTLRGTWQKFYGAQTKARAEMRRLAKAEKWHNLDDARLMREAAVWVRMHHVHHSLSSVLDEMYRTDDGRLPDWDEGTRTQWIKRLKPYDLALGRKRRGGPLRP